mgnify:CR=1 FL=1
MAIWEDGGDMRKRITIEVEVSGHEQFDEEQVDKFLASEFCGCPIECEEYDKLVESIDYRVVSCIVE